MDTTIDEIRAGWEQMREQVKALQLTAQFYAERNQQQITEKERLIEENCELKIRLDDALRNKDIITEWLSAKDELLWWVTADNYRDMHQREKERQMLATQGYTRENLEKR